MKQLAFVIFWLSLPLMALLTHLFHGAEFSARDQVRASLAQARQDLQAGEYQEALSALDNAIEKTPANDVAQRQRLQLRRAQVKLEAGLLQDAYVELKGLRDELHDPSNKPEHAKDFQSEVDRSLAATQFFGAWRMRLQGAPEEVWKPYAEASRQTYRKLQQSATTDADRQRLAEDGEAVIRMERMPIQDLKTVRPTLGLTPEQRQRHRQQLRAKHRQEQRQLAQAQKNQNPSDNKKPDDQAFEGDGNKPNKPDDANQDPSDQTFEGDGKQPKKPAQGQENPSDQAFEGDGKKPGKGNESPSDQAFEGDGKQPGKGQGSPSDQAFEGDGQGSGKGKGWGAGQAFEGDGQGSGKCNCKGIGKGSGEGEGQGASNGLPQLPETGS